MALSLLALPVLCLIWAGMLLGVSFIATPVKFRAKTLEFATAIDVGRVTFGLFSKIEWVMAAIVTALCVLTTPGRTSVALAAIAVLAVIIEAIILLPRLDARAARIVGGQTLAPSWVHKAYIVLEVVKLGCLVTLAVLMLNSAH